MLKPHLNVQVETGMRTLLVAFEPTTEKQLPQSSIILSESTIAVFTRRHDGGISNSSGAIFDGALIPTRILFANRED